MFAKETIWSVHLSDVPHGPLQKMLTVLHLRALWALCVPFLRASIVLMLGLAEQAVLGALKMFTRAAHACRDIQSLAQHALQP